MRKKILCLTAVAVIAVLSLTLFAACNKKKGGGTPSEISRSVSALFVGESGEFAVSVEKGSREKNFIADGKVTDVAEFAEITVTPLTANAYTAIEFTLSAEGNTLAGTVNGNTFGEFRTEIALGFNPVSVTLKAGETEQTIELQNVLDGALTTADVVNIAKEAFAERIAEEKEAGKSPREIYVKLITGDRENYYYYVSFIGEGTDYWAMLVDPNTGEIVSKK